MKKILFIYDRYLDYFEYFQTAAANLEIDLILVDYDSISIEYAAEKTTFWIGQDRLDDFDVVYLRNAWRNVEVSTLISEYCRKNSIKLSDPIFIDGQPWIDRKSFEYLKLQQAKLPIIPSQLITQTTLGLHRQITYPAVTKVTDSSQGEGVFLAKSEDELLSLFAKTQKTHLLVQKYIKNDGDYRLFVIGNRVVASMKRSSQDEAEFKNNVSLGGSTQTHQPTDTEISIALEATHILGYDFAGVDLIKNQSGDIFIMEVNRSPQFEGIMKTTGVNIPQLMLEYLADL